MSISKILNTLSNKPFISILLVFPGRKSFKAEVDECLVIKLMDLFYSSETKENALIKMQKHQCRKGRCCRRNIFLQTAIDRKEMKFT